MKLPEGVVINVLADKGRRLLFLALDSLHEQFEDGSKARIMAIDDLVTIAAKAKKAAVKAPKP